MNQEVLIKKINEYQKATKRLKEIDDLIVPPFVKKPVSCKADEWIDYMVKKVAYQKAVHIKSVEREEVEKNIDVLKKQLIHMLPSSNVWFITDDEKFAIGHQSTDWPMDDGRLMIINNPKIDDLYEIHHQITQ